MNAVTKKTDIDSGRRPDIELDDGIVDLFRYWDGASGTRYVFTEIDPGDIADYPDTVVMLVEGRRRAPSKLRFLGEAGAWWAQHGQAALTKFKRQRLRAFIHFIAESAEGRRKVIADLAAAL